jgi:uncharacterized protein YecE (DUF72 family)
MRDCRGAQNAIAGQKKGLVKMKLYLGCAVWSFPGWMGDIYPTGTRSKKFLNLYSHYFPAVEGNTTFYAVPEAKTVDRWRTETPEGFRFCLKLPRDFTHSGLLSPQIQKSIGFLNLVSRLAEKLAMVFIQLPPKYHADYYDDLEEFLTALARVGMPLALEVRHHDWFQPNQTIELQGMLNRLRIDRVILDTQPIYRSAPDPEYSFLCKKPDVPLIKEIAGEQVLIRYVSHPRQALNQVYMEAWADQIGPWLAAGKEVYLFVHCPIEEQSPSNARYFQQILRDRQINIHPLPWQASPSSQMSLDI